jgi:Flp pilus assembly protein TadD
LASNEIAAPALSQSPNVALCVANVSAMTGNDSAALRMVDDLSHKRPQDTWFQAFYLPAIRARIEINHGNGAKALELLKSASSHDKGEAEVLALRGQAFCQCRPPAIEIAFGSLRAARTRLCTSSRDRGCETPSTRVGLSWE